MATSVFDSLLREIEGETKALSTTAGFIAVKPEFHEVTLHCSSPWRLALTPKLIHVLMYDGTSYTDYTSEATDGSSSTHVPLDAMTTSETLYLGTSENTRGFWIDMGSNVQSTSSRTLDVEYYKQFTISSAAVSSTKTIITTSAAHGITTGEIVTIWGTDSYNGTWTTESASASVFTIDTTFTKTETGLGKVFADVSTDVDGTNTTTTTLSKDGLYYFVLPTNERSTLGTAAIPLYSNCYWIRITPSATLSTTVDINEIIPAYKNTNYKYMEAGIEYQISINTAMVGGLEVVSIAGTPTLDIGWIKH